jgi:hypothetical protein
MDNFAKTVVGQYNQSTSIMSWLSACNDAIDPSADLDKFYEATWNIETANTAGLDIWGRIVNVSRYITSSTPQKYWGFEQGGREPFNNAPFFVTGNQYSQTYALSNDVFRKLILCKAMTNISRSTIKTINYLLMYLFGGPRKRTILTGPLLGSTFVLGVSALGYVEQEIIVQDCRGWVVDMGGMVVKYKFDFPLEPWERAIILQSGAFPKPSGVQIIIEDGWPS